MFYLGIDVGKNNHEAGFIREDGSHVGKSLRFPNSQDGFDALSAFIISRLPENESFCIGMEATGHYWLALYFIRFSLTVLETSISVSRRLMLLTASL